MPKKKRPHWNYRVLTRLVTTELGSASWREFYLAEVHYGADGVLEGSGESHNLVAGYENVKDLKWAVKHMKKAFKKPILDGDNWPNVYIP